MKNIVGNKRHFLYRICHLAREDTTLRVQKVVRLEVERRGARDDCFSLCLSILLGFFEPRCMYDFDKSVRAT